MGGRNNSNMNALDNFLSKRSSSSGGSGGSLNVLLVEKLGVLSEPLSPMHTNIVSALLTIVYVKVVLEIAAYVRSRSTSEYGVEWSRKLVHFAACSYVLFWPLFDASHWGWRLNVTVPVVMSLRLLYKGAILNDPEDDDVRTMSRTSSPSELLYGPLQMTLIMCYIGITKYMTNVGILMMASLIGDGVAAIVGMQYGRHLYKVPFGSQKSIEGTIGCAIGTMIGIWFYSYMCDIEIIISSSNNSEGEGWKTYLMYGCLSAAVEATALRNWDNLLLAMMMELSVTYNENLLRSHNYSAIFPLDRIRGWLFYWKNG